MSFAKQLNYYEALGIEDTASAAEIEAAYENIKRKFNVGDIYDTTDINLRVERYILARATEAYKTLSKPDARKDYDLAWNEETKTTETTIADDAIALLDAQEKGKKGILLDYYGLLGIPRSASWEDVNQAYIKYASLYYPKMTRKFGDKSIDDSVYRLLMQAYGVLSNREMRAAYDVKFNQQTWEKQEKKEKTPIKVDPSRVNMPPKKKRSKVKKNPKKVKENNSKHDSDSDLIGDLIFNVGTGIVRVSRNAIKKIASNPNRALFLATVAITGIISAGIISHPEPGNPEPQPTRPPLPTPSDEVEPDEIVLNRIHVVEEGEVLQTFSEDSNTLVSHIKDINNIENSDLIHPGDTIVIPYIIDKDDLGYYTQKVECDDDMTVSQLAEKYGTDIDTIVAINKKDILVMPQEKGPEKNSYIPLSDTLLVPNFISKQTYNSLKASGQTNIQQTSTGQQK